MQSDCQTVTGQFWQFWHFNIRNAVRSNRNRSFWQREFNGLRLTNKLRWLRHMNLLCAFIRFLSLPLSLSCLPFVGMQIDTLYISKTADFDVCIFRVGERTPFTCYYQQQSRQFVFTLCHIKTNGFVVGFSNCFDHVVNTRHSLKCDMYAIWKKPQSKQNGQQKQYSCT